MTVRFQNSISSQAGYICCSYGEMLFEHQTKLYLHIHHPFLHLIQISNHMDRMTSLSIVSRIWNVRESDSCQGSVWEM